MRHAASDKSAKYRCSVEYPETTQGAAKTIGRVDPYVKHRLGLVAISNRLAGSLVDASLIEAVAAGGPGFANFLVYQKLGSLWHHRLTQSSVANRLATDFTDALRQARVAETALYMFQRSCLREIDHIFTSKQISYAVIKGAHVRELVYADPASRPAGDIDVLVPPDQRELAVLSVIDAGFILHAN